MDAELELNTVEDPLKFDNGNLLLNLGSLVVIFINLHGSIIYYETY